MLVFIFLIDIVTKYFFVLYANATPKCDVYASADIYVSAEIRAVQGARKRNAEM
jgi:hypothetical protein